MKAAVLNGYDKNGADLVVKDVPEPECGPSDVLVKVMAAGVNPLDNMIIRKEVSLIVGYDMPLVMGNELSGVVERIGAAGSKYDRMAAKRGQRYRFVFVHSDGAQLAEASNVLAAAHVEPSVDGMFGLDDVNEALRKVASGGSRGKTILEIG